MANDYDYVDLESKVYENYDVKGASPYEMLQMMNSWNKELRMTISNSFDQVQTQIALLDGEIELSVKSDNIINAINLSQEGLKINVNRMDITGLVTFTALSTDGMTAIHGGNILTGTIMAQDIYAQSFESYTIKGAIIDGGIVKGVILTSFGTSAQGETTISNGTLTQVSSSGSVQLTGGALTTWNGIGETARYSGSSITLTSRTGSVFRMKNLDTPSIEVSGWLEIFGSVRFYNTVDFGSANVIGSPFPTLASHQKGATVSFSGTGDMTWVVNGTSFTYRKV